MVSRLRGSYFHFSIFFFYFAANLFQKPSLPTCRPAASSQLKLLFTGATDDTLQMWE